MRNRAIRRAIDAAILDMRKPLADLTPEEQEVLYGRVVYHFILQNAERGRGVVICG